MKPYYERDGITIYHGDCRDVLPTLEADSVDLVLTDPPYGRGKYETDECLPAWVYRSLFSLTGRLAVFGYPEDLAGIAIIIGRQPGEWVTWWPTNKAGGRSLSRLPKEQEAIAIYGETPGAHLLMRPRAKDRTCHAITTSRGLSTDEARLGDVWRDASPGMAFNFRQRQHPNEKPISLMRRLVVLMSQPGETILDACAGSGSTLVSALLESRRAIGIEIEERYCEIAARRLAQQVLPLEVPV